MSDVITSSWVQVVESLLLLTMTGERPDEGGPCDQGLGQLLLSLARLGPGGGR